MVARLTSEPAVLDADVEPMACTDLSVEPVERVPDAEAGGVGERARTRVHLKLRVAALEAALARARRRRQLVVDQYERVLERHGGGTSPEFSWRD